MDFSALFYKAAAPFGGNSHVIGPGFSELYSP